MLCSKKQADWSTKGQLDIEALWDCPLTVLDQLARQLRGAPNDSESFIKPAVIDEVAKLKFEIVKYIIKARLDEIDAKRQAAETKQHNNDTLWWILQILCICLWLRVDRSRVSKN